jgi:hypothetical protein
MCSTGHRLEIDEDVDHLTQALIGEIALSAAKEHNSWEKGLESLVSEVADCVLRLREQEKNSLLRGNSVPVRLQEVVGNGTQARALEISHVLAFAVNHLRIVNCGYNQKSRKKK